jgi:hypothetical protein
MEEELETTDNNTFRALSSFLASIGLGNLFSYEDGQPAGWLWEQVQNGITNEAELLIGLQQTDDFKQRFPLIAYQQEQNAAGNAMQVLTPGQVIEYETAVIDVFKRAGLPSWFYDDPVQDVQQRMQNGLSAEAIIDRVETAYQYVAEAPIEVRQAFEQFYGVADSDAALASYMLDPEKTIDSLNKAKRSAYTAGIGARRNINVSQQQAERIAEMPMNEAGISEGLSQVAGFAGLYRESVGETKDLSAETTGIGAVFESDVEAVTELERRQLQRGAVSGTSQGGAALTQQGVIGL